MPNEEISKYLSQIGKKGGSAKSELKAISSKNNGKKGGRHHKMTDSNDGQESPFSTVKDIKEAFCKKEISWDGAWEFLCRFFNYTPKEAKDLVDLWEGRNS